MHYGLVTPHIKVDLGQHCLGKWLGAWQHPAITWTNVDFALVRFCGIYLRKILQGVPRLLFCIRSLKTRLLKLLPHLPGTSELNKYSSIWFNGQEVYSTNHTELFLLWSAYNASKLMPTSSMDNKVSQDYCKQFVATFWIVTNLWMIINPVQPGHLTDIMALYHWISFGKNSNSCCPGTNNLTGFWTWVDSTFRVATQHSNQFGQRVGPASERLAGRLGCHIITRAL